MVVVVTTKFLRTVWMPFVVILRVEIVTIVRPTLVATPRPTCLVIFCPQSQACQNPEQYSH